MLFNKKTIKPIYITDTNELINLGITDEVKLFEDGFRTNKGRGFFEWWYFDAHLDDGTTVVIVYMTKSITEYKGPLKPSVMITITRPDGAKLFETQKYSPKTFSASKHNCDVKIGPNWVKGDLKKYELHATIEEIEVNLTFTGIVPPWRPRDGKIFFGNRQHHFGWVAPIPHGSVEGTLAYDNKTHEVTGSGYHDHNWGNLSLPTVQDHWYWGRTTLDEYTVLFVEQTTSKTYGSIKLPVFLLAKGNKVLTGDGKPLTLETSDFIDHSSGHKYPNKLVFSWISGDDEIIITLKNPQIIEAASLLGSFPKWKQKIAGIFVNPYYFRFNAQINLEINFGGIKILKTGSILYELMQLK